VIYFFISRLEKPKCSFFPIMAMWLWTRPTVKDISYSVLGAISSQCVISLDMRLPKKTERIKLDEAHGRKEIKLPHQDSW
jgi:hypothetical protein